MATFASEPLLPSAHEMTFAATGLGSGVYFCRLSSGAYSAVTKLVVLR